MTEIKPKSTEINMNTEYFDKCYNSVVQTLNMNISQIELRNIVPIITMAMTIVQTFKKLNGAEKKDLVIDVVQKLIRDSDHNEHLENALIQVVDNIGHPLIDTLIMATKGKFFQSNWNILKNKCLCRTMYKL
jgi:hypothetical protein